MTTPALPEGWTLDEHYAPMHVTLCALGIGYATIHYFKRRVYRGDTDYGWTIEGGWEQPPSVPYQGRGWRDRMLADAIAYLRSCA